MATETMSLLFLGLMVLIMSSGRIEAKDFLVGGSVDAWKIPSNKNHSLNRWAEINRFQVGDYLVWMYDSERDSVLEVTRKGYLTCNTTNPIAEHRNGTTVVQLSRSGAYYFISGAKGACEAGEKIIIVVLSKHHHISAPVPAPGFEGPAMAPTSGVARMIASDASVLFSLILGTLVL